MQHPTGASDVLRGIALAGAPLRLGRARASEAPEPVASPQVTDHERLAREERSQALREAREQGLRESRAEGLRDGLREGRAQAEEEIRAAVQRAVAEAVLPLEQEHAQLLQLAQGVRRAVADALEAAHDEMAALCFETLCRIVGTAASDPEIVHAQLTHLLQQHGSQEVVLHLHPQDARLLQSRAGAQPQASVRWQADAEVTLGGCILQTPGGGIDARLETMLDACKAALLEARRRQGQATDAGGGR